MDHSHRTVHNVVGETQVPGQKLNVGQSLGLQGLGGVTDPCSFGFADPFMNGWLSCC